MNDAAFNAIEIQQWYNKRFQVAEAEYKIVKREAAKATNTSDWKRLEREWEKEFSNMRADLNFEMSRREEDIKEEIAVFEDSLHGKTAEWKSSDKNWSKLKDWRRELQALKDCEEMRNRTF